MWCKERQRLLCKGLRYLLLNAIVMSVLSVPVFCQMSYGGTTYTDYTISDTGRLHAWGYTYAPSGSAVVHTYQSKTKIILPGGNSNEVTANGSGFSPAIANVYIDMLDPSFLISLPGEIKISTRHEARCIKYVVNAGLFLATNTSEPPFQTGFTERWFQTFAAVLDSTKQCDYDSKCPDKMLKCGSNNSFKDSCKFRFQRQITFFVNGSCRGPSTYRGASSADECTDHISP
jgi:hypothetical protein